MIKKYRSLGPVFHTVFFCILAILLFVLINIKPLGDYSIFVYIPVLLLFLFEVVFGFNSAKKGNFEIELIKKEARSFDLIEESLISDKYQKNLINDDPIYFKVIDNTLVEIDIRRHFGMKKYKPQNENIVLEYPKAKRKLSIVIVPKYDRKYRYFARYLGSYEKNEAIVAIAVDKEMYRMTSLGEFERIFRKIYDKHIK